MKRSRGLAAHTMKPPRGLALLTTLYVAFVLLLFGMTLASLAGFGYQFSNDRVHVQKALEAAQAGLSDAIYNLSANGATTASDAGQMADVSWSVTYNSTQSAGYSVNNLSGATTVPGWLRQPVPPYSALVVSSGTCKQTTRTVEAVVQYAAFPYALAASGQVSSNGVLSVTGAVSLDSLLGTLVDGLLGSLLNTQPTATGASVYGGTGVSSAGAAVVSGEVQSPGTINLSPLSVVSGGTNTNAAVLPELNVSAYSDVAFEGVTELSPNGTYATIQGPTYVNGSITLSNAVLNNAYLYVDGGGSLTSTGGLSGTGSIFVTGSTDLEGNMAVSSSDGIAIFSQGALQIHDGSYFQGVLYSNGNITVSEGLTVIGAVVAVDDSGPNVTLASGAQIIGLPEYTRFGTSWSQHGMLGSALLGSIPLMNVVFWRQMQ